MFQAEWPRAIEELCSFPHIEEAAVLSTCNRMELYVVAVSWHRVGISAAAKGVKLVQACVHSVHAVLCALSKCCVVCREFEKLKSGCHIAVVCL